MSNASPPQPPSPAAPKPELHGVGARRLNSASLFGSAVELVIVHRGAEYRLRQTAQGKLILTK